MVGRPAPGSRYPNASGFAFADRADGCDSGGFKSRYNSCASLAGPRRTPSAATSTTRTYGPFENVITSPICRAWLAFFTGLALTTSYAALVQRWKVWTLGLLLALTGLTFFTSTICVVTILDEMRLLRFLDFDDLPFMTPVFWVYFCLPFVWWLWVGLRLFPAGMAGDRARLYGRGVV